MVRRILILAVLVVVLSPSAEGAGDVRAAVTRFNVVGDSVEIALVNRSDETVTMGDIWTITPLRRGGTVAEYCWPRAELRLEPGERRVWNWDQREDAYGMCAQSHPGDQVAPGPYRVTFEGMGRSARFHIGQFFQVGFDHLSEDERFTVYVNRSSDIAAMTDEAQAEDKTQMVTGIVRDARGYNSPWNFTMGPGSIVLAEVSVEVCDADPYYVQDHKRRWMGERWCPWSSYVAAVGR